MLICSDKKSREADSIISHKMRVQSFNNHGFVFGTYTQYNLL